MRFILISICAILVGCSSSDPSGTNGDTNNGDSLPKNGTYRTVNAFPNLSFSQPVDLQHAGDNSQHLFVVEQEGIIRVFDNNPTTETSSVFLDISSRLDASGNGRRTPWPCFPPNYENNGYFYVNYTASDPNRTVIARYQVMTENLDAADPESELQILSFAQPFNNHNGGQLALALMDTYTSQ
ncbi:MAG: hypothetical protein U5J63_17515 [Fodinibius sp.]|nr:hypothetical protein [Fodinibius sp.]